MRAKIVLGLKQRWRFSINKLCTGAVVDEAGDENSSNHGASCAGAIFETQLLGFGDGPCVMRRNIKADPTKRDIAEIDRTFPAVGQQEKPFAAGGFACVDPVVQIVRGTDATVTAY